MVGRACSHDDNGCCRYVSVSVHYTDDILPGTSADEVYAYDRHSGEIVRKYPAGSDELCKVPYSVFVSVFKHVKALEADRKSTVSIEWRYSSASTVDVIGCELSEDVWLPVSACSDGMRFAMINVTDVFFTKELSPLEASFVTALINSLVYEMGIVATDILYADGSMVFASCDILRIIKRLFGPETIKDSGLDRFRGLLHRACRDNRMKMPRLPSRYKVVRNLESIGYPSTVYCGNETLFAIGVMRDAISSVASAVAECIKKGAAFRDLVEGMRDITDTACEKLVSIGNLFVARGNVSRLADVYYLTYNDLLAAFAFSEDAMSLAPKVRASREHCRRLARIRLPDVVSCKSALYYIEEKVGRD